MTSVGAYEAKTHLPRLLDEVAGGATVTITKHGRAVARLVPITRTSENTGEVIDELRRLRTATAAESAESILAMRDEGRR